jgi:uncharacterized protein YciI
MPYFALLYDTVDNFIELRQPYRVGHLQMIDDAYRSGRLVLAGALKPSGALLVFNVPTGADVEAFARTDPYVVNGLVTSWRVHEWAVVVGEHAVPR